MHLHMVNADLDKGTLIKIRAEGIPRGTLMPMRVVFRKDAPPGPAGRAFIAQLKQQQAGEKEPAGILIADRRM